MINLPKDDKERKACPVWSGFVKYFPNAIIAVSKWSRIGSDQHHPGAPVHWDKEKSKDDMDSLMRHALEGHHEAVAWRAMANLERELLNGYEAKSWEEEDDEIDTAELEELASRTLKFLSSREK